MPRKCVCKRPCRRYLPVPAVRSAQGSAHPTGSAPSSPYTVPLRAAGASSHPALHHHHTFHTAAATASSQARRRPSSLLFGEACCGEPTSPSNSWPNAFSHPPPMPPPLAPGSSGSASTVPDPNSEVVACGEAGLLHGAEGGGDGKLTTIRSPPLESVGQETYTYTCGGDETVTKRIGVSLTAATWKSLCHT